MSDTVSTLEETGAETTGGTHSTLEASSTEDNDLLEDSLVEEVSIDGMCGVY